jgi:glycosyltransferase involved in cell wall biosynthesis
VRILFVNHVSYISGAENSLMHLIAGLDQSQHQCWALCPPNGPLVGSLSQRGCTVITTEFSKSLPQFARIILRLNDLIKYHQIDLIHANSIDAIQYAALASRWRRIPLVGHVRNIVPFRRRGLWLVKQADRLIAVSKATQHSLVSQGVPAEKVEVIYNGIDPGRYPLPVIGESANRPQFNLPCGVPLVGSVGRLHPIKGFVDFLRAARQVIDIIPDVHFAIAGRDPEPGERYFGELTHLMHELNLAERVHFLGEIDQVSLFLQSLDVFVLPSLQEPFARAILEAMGCACSIVATAVGGTPEAIEDGRHGLLIPPASPDALASAIMRLLGDHEYAIMLGRAAHERVVTQFSITSNVERTQALYRELVQA